MVFACGPGAGTPAENVFFKNIRTKLDEDAEAHSGIVVLPDALKGINQLEKGANVSDGTAEILCLPTFDLQFARLDLHQYAHRRTVQELQRSPFPHKWFPTPQGIPRVHREWTTHLKLDNGYTYQGQLFDGKPDGVGAMLSQDTDKLRYGFWNKGEPAGR